MESRKCKEQPRPSKQASWGRLACRFVAFAALAYVWFVLWITYIDEGHARYSTQEWISLALFPLTTTIALVGSHWRRLSGAALALLSSWVFIALQFRGFNQITFFTIMALIAGLITVPLAILMLFGISAYRRRGKAGYRDRSAEVS